MFKGRTLRSYFLRLPELGLAAEDLVAGTGITWPMIDQLNEVGPAPYAVMLDRLAALGSPDFALHCGNDLRPQELGLVGLTVMSSRDMRDAIEVWCKYAELADYPLGGSLTISDDRWEWRLFPKLLMTPRALRFCVEAALSTFHSITTELTGDVPHIAAIGLPFARPPDVERYRFLGARHLRFNTPTLILSGALSSLSRKVRSADPDSYTACLAQCLRVLTERQHWTSIAERIAELMASAPATLPTIDDLAAALGLSKRTLQRKLAMEDTSYQDLLRNFRLSHVASLRDDNGLSVKQIAFRAGYRDPSSIYRLQRAAGKPPGQHLHT